MTGRRLLLTVALASLLPGSACLANTIELETTTSDSSEGGGVGSDTGPDEASASVTVTTTSATTTTTTTTTTTATSVATTVPADESGSVDTSVGPVLDIGVDPGEPQTLLWAVDTVVALGLPLQGIVRLQYGGQGTVDLELQWLTLEPGSTTSPRELLGDVYAYSGIPVSPDGSFTWDTGVILIPAAANPITGSDLILSISAEVTPQGAPYCGSVDGEVTSPIIVPLAGSTHAMTSVPSPDELPLEFPTSCP